MDVRFASWWRCFHRAWALIWLAGIVAGCAGRDRLPESAIGSGVNGSGSPLLAVGSVELESVPFFPQQRYQCGPASLATVLRFSGVDIEPAELVEAVYLPARKGSLQPEMAAAARSHGRVPFLLEGSLDALVLQLHTGYPVLVLQNLGISRLPVWHYAVVVGYDAARQRFLLRSGTRRRLPMKIAKLERTWRGGGYWALVLPPPGQLPAGLSATGVAAALAGSQAHFGANDLLAYWEAALQRWPEQELIVFGAANAARLSGEGVLAAQYYRRLLALEPNHLAARNNYADLLLVSGCYDEARGLAAEREAEPAHGLYADLLVQTRREIDDAIARDGAVHAPGCRNLLPQAATERFAPVSLSD